MPRDSSLVLIPLHTRTALDNFFPFASKVYITFRTALKSGFC
jgi:hypothetical protein